MIFKTRLRARLLFAVSLGVASLGCAKKPAPPSFPAERAVARRSTAAERERVALTVYNSNFAVVREERRLRLGTGPVSLAYEDVAEHIQPATVRLRALEAPAELAVLEQNYRYDLLTPEKLLEHYVGRRVSLARYRRAQGKEEIVEAEVLATAQGPVLRVGGEIVTGLGDRVIFPELPPGLLPRPTLVWLLNSARDEQRVEVTYLTQNLSWRADYVLLLDPDEARGDLTGWVTIENRSGASFAGARLQLVAGDVQRLVPAPAPLPEDPSADFAMAEKSEFRQEPLFEYHLYGLERPTDVLDREQKQLHLLEARGVPLEKKLVLRGGSPPVLRRPGPALERQHPAVVFRLENRAAVGLGVPLPRGVVRMYEADASGARQFVGEDGIDHTPRDEPIELEIGRAFDIVAERRQVDYRALDACSAESAWSTQIRNHKDQAVQVEVEEPMSGEWELLGSSHPPKQREAERLTFQIQVAARAAAELEYRVRVRWCRPPEGQMRKR